MPKVKTIKQFDNDFQVEYIPMLCDNPNLHVIAYTESEILCRNIKTNKAKFIYTTSPDNLDNGMTFDFDLLSHCNDNATGIFTQILSDLHMHLETVETETDYYNTIVND